MSKTKSRRRWRLIGGAIVLVLALLAADYLLYPRWSGVGGRSFNHGENGSWLRYTWYFGSEKEGPRKMIQRLKEQQIRYAYFHVRFIKKDGKLRFHYPDAARQLTKVMHSRAPSVKAIAWIYVGNERGLTGVDLSNVKVRKAMVKEALWLVKTCGFDGVQWDYEICEDGDLDHLRLLRETRAALPRGKLLSVATAMWLPRPFRCWGWSDKYFAQVAATCDQMAVMCYDSALYFPRHYVWLMRQQAIHVTRAAARGNPQCRVLLGVPTYEDGGPSHHPYAENIRMALKGVREGMADPHANSSVFAGVAIFADYTTEPDEWKTYRDLWLK